ncbi:MAG: hypothetical protein ACE5OO_00355 [Candidatus Bathyarchaeia archaeon]
MRWELLGVALILTGAVLAIGGWWAAWDLIVTITYHVQDWSGFRFPLPFYLGEVGPDRWSMAFDAASWISLLGTASIGVGAFIIAWIKE